MLAARTRIIGPHIKRDRTGISLPQRMTACLLQEAHVCIGASARDIGGLLETRSHPFRTLALRLWHARAAALFSLFLISLLLALLGRSVRGPCENLKRRVLPAQLAG